MGGHQLPGCFETRFEQGDQIAVPPPVRDIWSQRSLSCGRFLLQVPVVPVTKRETRFPLLPFWFSFRTRGAMPGPSRGAGRENSTSFLERSLLAGAEGGEMQVGPHKRWQMRSHTRDIETRVKLQASTSKDLGVRFEAAKPHESHTFPLQD